MGEMWGVLDPLFQAAIYIFVVAVIRGGRGGGIARRDADHRGRVLVQLLEDRARRRWAIDPREQGLDAQLLVPESVASPGRDLQGAARVLTEHRPLRGHPRRHATTDRAGLFLLPLLFLLQTAMAIGMALLVATATVYVRDTVNLLNYVTAHPDLRDARDLPGVVAVTGVAHNLLGHQPALPALLRLPDHHPRRGADCGPGPR